MALTLDDRVILADDVVYRALGGEAVVLDLKSGVYFGLDEIGARIWTLAVDHDLHHVCRQLTDEFDAAPETIEQDVLELIGVLLDKQLVRIADAGDGPTP